MSGAGVGGAGGGEESQGLMGGGLQGAMGHMRGIVQRWPDADAVLQGGMSEGLRDWDLWYVVGLRGHEYGGGDDADVILQGSITFLPAPLLPLEHQRERRSALTGLLRRLCDYLARRGDRHTTDQALGREYVRLFPPSLPTTISN